jgi:aminopeptidase N
VTLTLSEARARAALVTDVSYDVELTLRAHGDRFDSSTVVRFTCLEPGATTFLELANGSDVLVTLNGEKLQSATYDGHRVTLDGLAANNEVRVSARLPYVTTGDGMHRFVDPVDGETYVSAYSGMDNAQLVFACFDQPDLKGPITLGVSAEEHWTVLASGRRQDAQEPGRWEFAPTPPIPTYLFVVCAGPWHSVGFSHDSREFGWHARQSLRTELERDEEDLRHVTVACWDYYATAFTEPYAFADYHQVFVPELNWGAQENPGCVTYRDEFLPPGRISDQQRARRATVIAHEMAHMWFGNLVTMRWFDDTWLSESFADYMGFQVANKAAGYSSVWTDFDAGYLPMAYDADERRSTHPVAPATTDVTDVDTAFANFDSLSYAKGNAVLRQLVAWLGEDNFLAGVNAYLTRHRFGSTALSDFVAALSEASGRNVADWVEAWLRTTGFDTIRVTRDVGTAVLHRTGSRPHRLQVTTYDVSTGNLQPADSLMVDLADDPVSLPDVGDRMVLPNSSGDTYARLRLDEDSLTAVTGALSTVPDPHTRAVLWTALGDLVRCAKLDPFDYLHVVARQLPAETSAGIFDSVLGRARRLVVAQYVVADEVAAAAGILAATCRDTLGTVAASADQAAVAHSATRGLAATSRDTGLLRAWLKDNSTATGLPLDPQLRWDVVRRLAEIADFEVPSLIAAELGRDPSASGQLGAARASAALADPVAKESAWRVMFTGEPSNRLFAETAVGFWSAEQHDLLAPYVDRYLAEAPALAARRGQAFSQIVGRAFPTMALGAGALRSLDAALAGDVPTVLRRAWEDRRDDLVLAVAVQERFGSTG